MTPEQRSKVAELNDAHRTQEDGRLMVTQAIMLKGTAFVGAVVDKVRAFTDFNADNDPHGEHDFGKIEHDGETVFWKIDTYADGERLYGSEEPWNPDASHRVLTVLLPEDY